MKIIAVTSPATDAGKTFLAAGLAESLTYQGYKTAFLDYDIAVGDSLRVFTLLNESRKPHPTITSWKNYPDLFQSALKVPSGTAIFPKPESQLEEVGEESVLQFINQLSKSFDLIVADLGSDHRLPHWEAMIEMAHSAILVVDCDEKALVRIKAFMQTNTRLPSRGWLLAVNSKEKTKTYSPKEIRRLIQDMNGVTEVLEVPYFKGVEEYTPKTFIPNSSFAKQLLGVLQENIEKTPEKENTTKSLVNINEELFDPDRSDPEEKQESPLDPADNSIALMLNGQIGSVQSLDEAKQKLSVMMVDAVFLQANIPHICEVIKELRRITRCTLVVIGETNASLIEAGADECFPALTPEVLSLVKAKAERLKKLWTQANIDDLTGCYLRNFMNECLHQSVQEYKEKGRPFSILAFDLNDFKLINDTYGHNTGDEVLRAFGEHLRRSCRKVDIPIRCGGDEFIIVVPNATKNMVLQMIERIKVTWQNNFEFPVSFSIGFAESGVDGETQEEILAAADLRMYEAKRQKKATNRSNIQNTVEFAKPKNKSNIFALLVDSNEEGLAAFSIYMARAASENGLEVVLIDCSLANPLIGPMLKVARTKDWRVRGVNATVLINEIKILPLSKKVTDNHKVEEKLRDLIKELTLICKDSLLVLNFGKGSPLLEVVQDFANILNFKINPNNYQYQLPSMDQWEKIPGEPDYVRDAAIINMVGRIRG